jgi:hypothetical protein
MAEKFDYDVAFSFAGEDRQVVEPVADRLKQANVSVFYDREKTAEMWGRNLDEYFADVFLNRARFCVMFVSHAYAEKMWARLERRSAMARAMKQKDAYILPIKLDDAELEGLLPTVHYISFSEHGEQGIVDLILEKLYQGTESNAVTRAASGPRNFNIPMPKIKKSFSQREKDVFARRAFETIRAYFEQGLKLLDQNDGDVEVEFDPVHRSKFLCRVYVKGEPLNTCKIWLGGWTHQGSDDHICYHEGRQVSRDRDDSTNDMLSVATDGHQLGLEGLGFGTGFGGAWNRGEEERLLSAERAAELLWQRFIKRLSVD